MRLRPAIWLASLLALAVFWAMVGYLAREASAHTYPHKPHVCRRAHHRVRCPRKARREHPSVPTAPVPPPRPPVAAEPSPAPAEGTFDSTGPSEEPPLPSTEGEEEPLTPAIEAIERQSDRETEEAIARGEVDMEEAEEA